MRLGLYHEPVHTDGVAFDTYGPFARYALAFARCFEHVTVFAPCTGQPTYFSGQPLDAPNLTVAPLPMFLTHAQAYARWRGIRRVFRQHADSLDAVNARGTAPLAYLLARATRGRRVPFVYHFASDPFEMIRTLPRYRGPRGWFARAAYGLEFAVQKAIVRRNYAFASGRSLADRLRRRMPNVEEVVDSTLVESDYHLRQDCCRGEVVRVLYVGALRAGKGLDHAVEAVRILRGRHRAVELDLVGDGDLREDLQAQVRRLGLDACVHFRGPARMGPQLNAWYDRADVFALPSFSEGSPRVVLEALGHSLPVVATDVGNIAEQLGAGRRGVLVPAEAPAALADGITRVIDDADLRARCIREGYQFARKHSLDAFVEQMARKIRQLADERRREARP